MLFRLVITRFVLKMVYLVLKFLVEGDISSDTLRSMGGNILKCISTHLYQTKYNENSMSHSDVQNYVSNKNWFE